MDFFLSLSGWLSLVYSSHAFLCSWSLWDDDDDNDNYDNDDDDDASLNF